MGRSIFRQETQIRASDTYTDSVAAGQTDLETNAVDLEDDLNSLRSQIKRVLDDSAGNWYDDIPTVNTKKRDLKDLNTDLDDMEEKRFIGGVTVLDEVTVGGATNVHIIGNAGELPTQTAAVGAGTALGAIVALHGGTFGQHSLDEVTGKNALAPKNLCKIRGAGKDAITSGGYEVFALLQAESGVGDGDTFNTTDKRVQLSFVRNNGSDDLEAVPAADIQGQTIEYMYPRRVSLDTLPEDLTWPPQVFSDQVAAVDVTLDAAIDNQSGAATAVQNIDVDLAASIEWWYRDAASADLLGVKEDSAGSASTVQLGSAVDVFDNDAVDNNFANQLKVDTAGTEIDIGVNAGVIETTSTNDMRLLGAGELLLDDGNQTGWTQTTGIKLSENGTEWTDFKTAFGEVSLLNAIKAAADSANVTKYNGAVTAAVAADADVGGPGTANNLDANIHAMDGGTFATDHDIYVNGGLQRGGADAAANNDVYPGSTSVQLKFEFKLKVGDEICVISRA